MSGLADRLVTAAREAFRENAASRPGGPAHPLFPALAAALRVLADDAMEDMRTAHESAQASRLDTHKHDFLGERAAYLRMHERLVELAGVVERGEQG